MTDTTEITARVKQTLAEEEARVEKSIFDLRVIVLLVFAVLATVNARSVSREANLVNLGVLVFAGAYKLILFVWTRRAGYHPAIKYFTSFFDIILVYLLMIMYAQIDAPAVALKNYVFYLIFPIIALTIFCYNQLLTWLTGGLAVILYLGMFAYLYLSGSVTIAGGGYHDELFSQDVTIIGQATKVMMLIAFVAITAHLTRYTRKLFDKLVVREVSQRVELAAIQQELNIARQIQQSILPQSFSPFPDRTDVVIHAEMIPAREVGGDFYDFFPIDAGRLGFVIGDVSGKGVPAAIFMAMTRSLLKATALKGVSPDQCLQDVNISLCQDNVRSMFVSIFYGVLNIDTGEMEYCNGGHNLPCLLSANGSVETLEKVGGMVLGAMEKSKYLAKKMVFQPGDTLFLYTDGVTEAMDSADREFSEDRLIELLQKRQACPPAELIRSVVEEVKAFAAGAPQSDDITALAIRILP